MIREEEIGKQLETYSKEELKKLFAVLTKQEVECADTEKAKDIHNRRRLLKQEIQMRYQSPPNEPYCCR